MFNIHDLSGHTTAWIHCKVPILVLPRYLFSASVALPALSGSYFGFKIA